MAIRFSSRSLKSARSPPGSRGACSNRARRQVGPELLQQRAELDPFVLGNGPLQAGHLPLVGFVLADDADGVQDVDRALADGNRMAGERVLRDVGPDERAGAVDLFQVLLGFAQVLLLERLDIERVARFEDRLQGTS